MALLICSRVDGQLLNHERTKRIRIRAVRIDQQALLAFRRTDGEQDRTVIGVCHAFKSMNFIDMKLFRRESLF